MPTFPIRPIRLALVALPLLLACRLERTPPPPVGSLPEPPRAVGLGPDGGVDRDRVLAAGRAGTYDQNPGASHRAALDDGVEVTIEPAEGAYRIGKDGFDQGVVVARLVNHGQGAVARLGIEPGATTYWLVYRREGELYSALITDLPTARSDLTDIATILHPPTRPWRQSLAQWQLPGVLGEAKGMGALGLVAGGQIPWVTCTEWGCCKFAP